MTNGHRDRGSRAGRDRSWRRRFDLCATTFEPGVLCNTERSQSRRERRFEAGYGQGFCICRSGLLGMADHTEVRLGVVGAVVVHRRSRLDVHRNPVLYLSRSLNQIHRVANNFGIVVHDRSYHCGHVSCVYGPTRLSTQTYMDRERQLSFRIWTTLSIDFCGKLRLPGDTVLSNCRLESQAELC
jgi:hypothetical protein